MSDSDDDVVFIPNPTGKAQLPHARCACETHIFVAPPGGQLRHHGTAKNKETCATCFCYVCDKPAKECTSWAVPVTPPTRARTPPTGRSGATR